MNFEDEMLSQGVKKIDGYEDYHTFVCKKKIQFPSEETARQKAKYVANATVYQCPTCHCWHIRSRRFRG